MLTSPVFARRMILVPVDTLKTTMQTRGAPGVQLLKDRVRKYGVGTLWYGAWATAAASFVGSFPWFATYNWLSAALPAPSSQLEKLLRQAFIGFAASVVSDTISNSLRVVKTYRQVHEGRVSYSKPPCPASRLGWWPAPQGMMLTRLVLSFFFLRT